MVPVEIPVIDMYYTVVKEQILLQSSSPGNEPWLIFAWENWALGEGIVIGYETASIIYQLICQCWNNPDTEIFSIFILSLFALHFDYDFDFAKSCLCYRYQTRLTPNKLAKENTEMFLSTILVTVSYCSC